MNEHSDDAAPGAGSPSMIKVAAGRLYLRIGPARATAKEIEVATTVLAQVFGPESAPCVALVSDPAKVGQLAGMIAELVSQLPDTHPHKPAGVLLTAAATDTAVKAVRLQITDMGGRVVVVYDARRGRGDAQGADALRQMCEEVGASYVLATSPANWLSMVEVGLDEAFPYDAAVVRYPDSTRADVGRALAYDADQLAAYHAIEVPTRACEEILSDPPTRLPAGLEPFPGRPLDRVTLARKHLTQRVAQSLFGATQAPRVEAAGLAAALRERVIGQNSVVQGLAEQVTLGLSGMRLRNDRPASALMLTGPTGTGKTLLAATLAKVLGTVLIRVDLAAYVKAEQIATLLGSPPGYVGSDRSQNWLTTRIEAAPNAVLLLDELDKSDPTLWAPLLMELLGAGTLTDELNRTVSCRALHVVITANIGADNLVAHPTGFGEPSTRQRQQAAASAVRRLLPDELFNRLDDVLVLSPVDRKAGAQILDQTLQELAARIRPLGYTVRVSHEAKTVLLRHGLHAADGARRLHRTVEHLVLTQLLWRDPGAYLVVGSGDQVRIRRCERHVEAAHPDVRYRLASA